jgi:hypothetical protein
VVLDNYDCKYGGTSENEGLPFVTDFDIMLDELVEVIWNWILTCVARDVSSAALFRGANWSYPGTFPALLNVFSVQL